MAMEKWVKPGLEVIGTSARTSSVNYPIWLYE